MKYQVKQKFFSLTDSFDILDEQDRVAFRAKGKLLSLSSSQTMTDDSDKELLKIKRKYLTLLPACRLVINDGSEWLIRKKFWPFWTSHFSIKTPFGELTITGNLWQHEYEIRQREMILASVSKKWFSFSDTYGVDIYEPTLAVQLLATVIVIDRIQHSSRNSSFGDD